MGGLGGHHSGGGDSSGGHGGSSHGGHHQSKQTGGQSSFGAYSSAGSGSHGYVHMHPPTLPSPSRATPPHQQHTNTLYCLPCSRSYQARSQQQQVGVPPDQSVGQGGWSAAQYQGGGYSWAPPAPQPPPGNQMGFSQQGPISGSHGAPTVLQVRE